MKSVINQTLTVLITLLFPRLARLCSAGTPLVENGVPRAEIVIAEIRLSK